MLFSQWTTTAIVLLIVSTNCRYYTQRTTTLLISVYFCVSSCVCSLFLVLVGMYRKISGLSHLRAAAYEPSPFSPSKHEKTGAGWHLLPGAVTMKDGASFQFAYCNPLSMIKIPSSTCNQTTADLTVQFTFKVECKNAAHKPAGLI